MPKFRLTPNPERLDDPAWKDSTFRGMLIIEADNEQEARRKAAATMSMFSVPVDDSGLIDAPLRRYN